MSAQRFMVTSKRGTRDTETGIMLIIEWVAMKDVNRALVSLRDHQMRYRAALSDRAGSDS